MVISGHQWSLGRLTFVLGDRGKALHAVVELVQSRHQYDHRLPRDRRHVRSHRELLCLFILHLPNQGGELFRLRIAISPFGAQLRAIKGTQGSQSHRPELQDVNRHLVRQQADSL